jgi:hypothetical protein
MALWGFGPDSDKYPVKPGSWWSLRGCQSHIFWCGSLLDLTPSPSHAPDLVYTDPPWARWALDTTQSSYLDTYRRAVALAAGAPCFLVGADLTADEVAATLPSPVTHRWDITYDHRLPAVLHYCGPPLPDGFDATGVDVENAPRHVLESFGGGGAVLDPCAGRGLTARCAERAGWWSINVEPHPRRVSVALARLGRLVDAEPFELTGAPR